MNKLNAPQDKPLFTPGPLTTSPTVKQSMLRDLGSRDDEFIRLVQEIRNEILALAETSQADGYECVLMQGSGTFGIEAVMTCAIPATGKWLIVINGAYGKRMKKIADIHSMNVTTLTYDENLPVVAADVDQAIRADAAITAVAVVHCETTTGMMNPIQDIGEVVNQHGKTYFVDSMSAFGGVAFDFRACQIDYLVSSANKCVEGVPGFSFCIAKKSALQQTAGWSRTLSLDLYEQWVGLENNGQFRFTPPTHAMLAYRQALEELKQEGGVAGRAARYRSIYQTLLTGMRALGFSEYLPESMQGHIITSFVYPQHPNFDFDRFYELLNEKGLVIYPGKVSNANCFRIGSIGQITLTDANNLLAAIAQSLKAMDVQLELVAADVEAANGEA